MPIRIPAGLPAEAILENENIFIMDEQRATHQDIRPLKIAIMNLMPTKEDTETQLIRLLSNSSLQVDLTLLRTATHTPKHVSAEHMSAFYKTFDEIKDKKFDGMVITGAPLEKLDYEDVDYWQELTRVMEWSKTNVFSTLHICWAAQAALYYHYGVPKYTLPQKLTGIYSHRVTAPKHPLMRGFDEEFLAPHSRSTEIRSADVLATGALDILADSKKAGIYIVGSRDLKYFFVTGHSEYDYNTIAKEYERDIKKGLEVPLPYNYFPDDNPENRPPNRWRGHAHLLFSNWLNYFVYQRTPYDIETL